MIQTYTWHGCQLSYLPDHSGGPAVILDVQVVGVVDSETWEHYHPHQRPEDVVENELLDITSELLEVERQRRITPRRRPRPSER